MFENGKSLKPYSFLKPFACQLADKTYRIAEQLGENHPDYRHLHKIVEEINELIELTAVD